MRKLKKSERAQLESFKTDEDKQEEKFNAKRIKYLDASAKIRDHFESKYNYDSEDPIEYDDIKESIKEDPELKKLIEQRNAASKIYFRTARAIDASSGTDYMNSAYEDISGGVVGSLQKDYSPKDLSAPENVKDYGAHRVKEEYKPNIVQLDTHKDLQSISDADPESLYRVKKSGSYFKRSDDVFEGSRVGSHGWEKVDHDPFTAPYKAQKELSEDELLDILVREKKKK